MERLNQVTTKLRNISLANSLPKTSLDKAPLQVIVVGLFICGIVITFGVILEMSSILVWSGLAYAIVFLIWIVFCALQGSELANGIFTSLFLIGLIVLSGATEAGSAGTLGLDISTIFRVLLLGCALLISLRYVSQYYNYLFKRPLIWLTLMIVTSLFSSLYSSHLFYSLALSLSLFVTVLYGIISAIKFDSKAYLTHIFWTLSIVVFFSWILFLVVPDVAIYKTILWNGEMAWRFEGISNHPNTMGLILGIYFGIVLTQYYRKRIKKSNFLIITAVIIITLLLTDSKTAIIATLFSALFFVARVKSKMTYLIIPSGIIVVLVFFIITFSPELMDKFLGGLSRSGDPNEVLSLTGRLGLWFGAFEAIKEAPLLGYGYMSTRWVLGAFAPNTWEGMHAHNMLIEGFIFFGLIGSIFLIMIYVDSLIQLFNKKLPLLTYFIPFTLLVGVTETSLLSRSLLFVFVLAIALTLSLKHNSIHFKLQLKNNY